MEVRLVPEPLAWYLKQDGLELLRQTCFMTLHSLTLKFQVCSPLRTSCSSKGIINTMESTFSQKNRLNILGGQMNYLASVPQKDRTIT